jgi:hypothetical protein
LVEPSHRSLVARRCRRDRTQAEDDGRKSFGKTSGQAGNCAPRGLTENAPVERFHSPIAGGLQPAGKGCAPSLTVVIRPRLPGAGAESRLPRGRQARSDLTRVKSDKKERAHNAQTDASEPHHASARRQGVCPKPDGSNPAAPAQGVMSDQKSSCGRFPRRTPRHGRGWTAGAAVGAGPRLVDGQIRQEGMGAPCADRVIEASSRSVAAGAAGRVRRRGWAGMTL